MYITLKGKDVLVVGDNKEIAVKSKIFKNWTNKLDDRFKVKSIEIQSVDLIGSKENPRVLFLKFKADVVDEKGRFVPGIVFMRGGSVGILTLLDYKGTYFTILTLQPRFPSGYYQFPEIPAGMLDGDGNFSGVAAKELKEETGLVINEKNIVDLTGLAYKNNYRGVYLSPGGSDEFIRLFLYCKKVDMKELNNLLGKQTGNTEEGENIILITVPYNNLIEYTADAKTLSALYLFEYLKKTRQLVI